MKKHINIFLAVLLLTISVSVLRGQAVKLSFKVKAPEVVESGRAFQVVFELNKDVDNFEGPDFKGFDVLGGPGYSKSSMTSIAGGKMVSEISTTYTYALMARQEGTFQIGEALVKIGRNSYKSRPFKIKVISDNTTSSENYNETSDDGGGDLFILNIVSNRSPYKGEVVVLTQKLYTRLAINDIGKVRLPSFSGFWTEAIEIGNYEIVQEQYQGKLYNTLILSRTLLIPQRTGRMLIEPTSVMIQRIVERTVNRRVFGGVIQQRVRELAEHEIKSSNLVLEVKELPSSGKPVSFSGTVGSFSIESQLSAESTEVGEPVELNIEITGSGNIKLIDNPKVDIPASMDLFEPEVTGKTESTVLGMSGSRRYLYIIIPRDTGLFTIPGVVFSYFNPATGKYSEITTGGMDLRVTANIKGKGYRTANIGKEDVRYFGRDIRFLSLRYRMPYLSWFTPGSLAHGGALFLPLLILVFWIIRYRKRVKMYANKDRMKFIKAEQTARQRIKEASVAMRQNQEERFYELLLEALWGYAADKFNLKTSELSRNRVREELSNRGVSTDMVNRFISVIDDCEFYRYAPVDRSGRMEKIHSDAVLLISEVEERLINKND